jgi:DNA-binding SARP family transcriptional activator/tetratricopeptide (TPR) repeat protein
LILDDFHLVDDSPDVRLIARELVARAPERLSIVFASRRVPTIPLARLRAAGEVAELGTDDLRFDADETHRLFSETYGRRLEPDVLADVVARTEGWAASLQLVDAALRDRTPAEIRRFVRDMSGADQELYDYLAEEVVGDLPEDLQQFLMRTAILQTVTPELAAVVAGLDPQETNRLTLAAERLTLLTRRSRTSLAPQRYHPLVREFLEARLRLTAGDAAVADMHRSAAAVANATDWRAAAYHYREAGNLDDVAAVVASAIPEIMGSGQYVAASGFVDLLPSHVRPSGLGLIQARMEMQGGMYETAFALSKNVLAGGRAGSLESDHALLNLMTMHQHLGNRAEVLSFADRLEASTANELLRDIAAATKGIVRGSNLPTLGKQLTAMSQRQRGRHPHYFGVSALNLAAVHIALDNPQAALESATQSMEALTDTASFIELSSAVMAKTTAMTMLGMRVRREDTERAYEIGQLEAVIEGAELADSFTEPEAAWGLLEGAHGRVDLNLNDLASSTLQTARYLTRRGRHDEALALVVDVDNGLVGTDICAVPLLAFTRAYVSTAAKAPEAADLVAEAIEVCKQRGVVRWHRTAQLLRGYLASSDALSESIASIGHVSPWNVTYVADLIASRLDDLDDRALEAVADTSRVHPGRWRFVLRQVVEGASAGNGKNAARALEQIGEVADIRRLRAYSRRQRRSSGSSTMGRDLARRLAEPVFVDDQQRVSIRIGQRHVAGSFVRRKVLALLCFLLTKQDFACTRDQVLEGLWPDLDPMDAVNSLNQTVYFLRRILEENYVDDLSPGYVHHDSELIWLDAELVTSRSNECRRLIKGFPLVPTPDQVQQLADEYVGRFALDFEYEEWAAPYRDWLHASYLEIVERALASDLETGHYARGIGLARRVLDVDPTADQVEVSLLRFYRASGAHAAAAEQYGHYAGVMRDQLGLDPLPLESL